MTLRADYSSKIQGTSTKVYANRLNFAVATLVKEKLEAQGATVVFTLASVKDDKTASQRVKILNDGNVELAIRIECNSVKSSDYARSYGLGAGEARQKAESDKLASTVLGAYIEATGLPLREVKVSPSSTRATKPSQRHQGAGVYSVPRSHQQFRRGQEDQRCGVPKDDGTGNR